MYICCSCNLHLYQALLYTTTTNSNIATCVSQKNMEKVMMSSDTEHFSSWKDYAYKVNVLIQEISYCGFLDKAAYIFNILLQFIVSPRFFCSMSAVIKENTKK